MNFLKKIKDNILLVLTLALLAFIPLYPKLPLIDVRNTWVYVRVEDFLVLFTLLIWFIYFLRRKIVFETPLTIPILSFWIIGAIATIHGVIIIFPSIAYVYPNVALLAYIRHIEYLSLFFVAFSAIKSRRHVLAAIWTIVGSMVLVIAYGFGQRYLFFPAYLTMNEEYAKGIPIIISPLNRISSTFAGHYDLAAYLVFLIPITVSLIFGFKNYFIKALLSVISLLGFVLLLMTVSRVSVFVVFIALFMVFLFLKRKYVLAFIPLILIAGVFFIATQQKLLSSLLARFGNTVEDVDVLVHAKTGEAVGQVTFHPRSYLYEKDIRQNEEVDEKISPITPLEYERALREGVPPHLIAYRLPKEAPIIFAQITSTGETLPQGSSYINLSLSPVVKRLDSFFIEYPLKEGSSSALVKRVYGEYLVKRASAYDLSFTTRFQGEWPNTIKAFARNLFLGSGYGSVSLAVDNNYLRMLGETGLLGTLSFISLFLILGIYIKKNLHLVRSRVIKAFILGFSAGLVGLCLNALLIDVFEASKIAFQMWLFAGVVVGAISLFTTEKFQVYREIKSLLVSKYAIIVYLFLLITAIFIPSITTYLSGDDFTWFGWAAQCGTGNQCILPSTITNYFFNSEGFFYRPGTKTYFLLMYQIFWLNQVVYHIISIALHFIVSALLYLLALKVLKNKILAAMAAFLFVLSSGYLEIVTWISATGHLFNAVFILVSLLLFIYWYETRKIYLLILSLLASLISLAFYELGIITPFLAISYVVFSKERDSVKSIVKTLKNKIFIYPFIPVAIYLVVRFLASTHWFNGDYSYNLIKLPFNFVGNALGYIAVIIFGPLSFNVYEMFRNMTRSNIPFALLIGILIIGVFYIIYKLVARYFDSEERRIIYFGFSFFLISLIPFLGLGNITFRYSYLASFGIFIILSLLIVKFYKYLLYYGRDIALICIATLISVFCLFHVIQTQQTIIEWRGAGERVKNFITSLESQYKDDWSNENSDTKLYFINVPIKNGNAWVFPVGLEDAVWFAFKNEKIEIVKVGSISEVPLSAFSIKNNSIFEFESNGMLKRYVLSKKGPIVDE